MLGKAPSPVNNSTLAARSQSPVQNLWAPSLSTASKETRLSTTSNPSPRHFSNGAGAEASLEAAQSTDLQDELAANFKDVQQNLATALERALGMVGRSMRSSKRLESEVLNLRVENHKLRARLDQMRRAQKDDQAMNFERVSSAGSIDSQKSKRSATRSKETKVTSFLKRQNSQKSSLSQTVEIKRESSLKSSISQAVELPGDVNQPPPPCIAFSSVVPSPPEQETLAQLKPEAEDGDEEVVTVVRRSARFADDPEDKSEEPDDSAGLGEAHNKRSVCFDGGLMDHRGSESNHSTRSSNDHVHFEVLKMWVETNQKKFSQKLGRYDISKSIAMRDGGGSIRQSDINRQSENSRGGEGETSTNLEESPFESEVLDQPMSLCEAFRAAKCVPPNSQLRSFWDTASCLLVFYDIVVIPLEFMEPEKTSFTAAMRWITRVFWTFDIPLSFLTGFVASDGNVEIGFGKVARRYLKTWFLLDLLLVFIDWLEIIWSDGDSFGFLRAGRGSRSLRIIRLVRLLRLIRIGSIMMVIAERVRSERLIILADVITIICAIVLVAHVMACLWYGIGLHEDSKSWVHAEDMRSKSLLARYSTSYHWSLSQFSGGMDEIRPYNIGERVYTILAFLFAFILAAVFVSRLTSSMTRLHMLSSTQAQQVVALRRYLGQNGISSKLALRIQKNAMHAFMEQQCLTPEDQVELLKLVSEPLLEELHLELYCPALCVHPFFGPYMDECPHVMRKVCHKAMSLVQVHVGDIIFHAGEIPLCPKMYILSSGELIYTAMVSAETVAVATGQWISEMALWTNWMHRGVLTATSNCRLSVLDAVKFQDIAGRFEHPPSFNPRAYATHFVSELNEVEGEITDLLIVSFPLSHLRRRGSGKFQGERPNGIRGFLKEAFANSSQHQKFGTRSLTRAMSRSALSSMKQRLKIAKSVSKFFHGG